MGRSVRTLAITVIALVTASPVLASPRLTVELDHSRRIMLSGVASSVIVSNPKIADVTLVDSHSVIVQGRGFGETDVMIVDRAGHMLMDSRVMVVAPSQGMVTIQRGPLTADFSCSPRCEALPVPGATGTSP